MARTPYTGPPESLREALGEDGFDYLSRLHEHMYGTGGSDAGQLDAHNLGTSGTGVLKQADDGAIAPGVVDTSELSTGEAGFMTAGDTGLSSKAKLELLDMQHGDTVDRRSVRTKADGTFAAEDTLDTAVSGAATLPRQEGTPVAVSPDTEGRVYISGGADPEFTIEYVTDVGGTLTTRKKTLNLSEDAGAGDDANVSTPWKTSSVVS